MCVCVPMYDLLFFVNIINTCSLLGYSEILYIVIAEPEKPIFAEEIQNVTVSVGRDALLACVVDNLRNYKVSVRLQPFLLITRIAPFHIYRNASNVEYQITRSIT